MVRFFSSEKCISFLEDPASFLFCSRKALRTRRALRARREFLEQIRNQAGSSGNEKYFSEWTFLVSSTQKRHFYFLALVHSSEAKRRFHACAQNYAFVLHAPAIAGDVPVTSLLLMRQVRYVHEDIQRKALAFTLSTATPPKMAAGVFGSHSPPCVRSPCRVDVSGSTRRGAALGSPMTS